MIAAAMTYALFIALLFAPAAWAVERTLAVFRWPRRGVWIVALVASLAVPCAVLLPEEHIPSRQSHSVESLTQFDVATKVQTSKATVSAFQIPLPVWPMRSELDSALIGLWIATSAGMLIFLAVGVLRFQRAIRQWPTSQMDGRAVSVPDQVGPAVFGILNPRIILPRWLLDAPSSIRSIVMKHEQAHIAARDPLLLTSALLLVVLAPWNVPLWWQLRRLRFAIEVDCDARVLQRGLDPAAYGETLLSVGQHRSSMPFGAMALTEPVSQLERRIRIMMLGKPRYYVLVSAVFFALATAFVVYATELKPPVVGSLDDTATFDGSSPSKKKRVLVQVPPATLDSYTGYYEYGGNLVVTVKREGQHLTVEFSDSKAPKPIYPESSTMFFYADGDAQISFTTDKRGQAAAAVLHQNGASTSMKRINTQEAKNLRAVLETKIHTQTPSFGGEAMLRRLLAGILSGKPNLLEMNSQLAAAINKDLPRLQVRLADLGSIKSIRWLRVDRNGMDMYEVTHERGSSQWGIALSPSGTLVGAIVPLVAASEQSS